MCMIGLFFRRVIHWIYLINISNRLSYFQRHHYSLAYLVYSCVDLNEGRTVPILGANVVLEALFPLLSLMEAATRIR